MKTTRKFKSLRTLYHDYASDCVETTRPRYDGMFKPEYAVARKGSIFTLNEDDAGITLESKSLFITFESLDELEMYIIKGIIKEI